MSHVDLGCHRLYRLQHPVLPHGQHNSIVGICLHSFYNFCKQYEYYRDRIHPEIDISSSIAHPHAHGSLHRSTMVNQSSINRCSSLLVLYSQNLTHLFPNTLFPPSVHPSLSVQCSLTTGILLPRSYQPSKILTTTAP